MFLVAALAVQPLMLEAQYLLVREAQHFNHILQALIVEPYTQIICLARGVIWLAHIMVQLDHFLCVFLNFERKKCLL